MPSASKSSTGTTKATKKPVKARATKSTTAAKKKTATKKVATKKTTADKAAKTAKTAKTAPRKTRAKSKTGAVKPVITSEERTRMIAEAAYYLAEKRGFAPGHEESDWLLASQQVDQMIING